MLLSLWDEVECFSGEEAEREGISHWDPGSEEQEDPVWPSELPASPPPAPMAQWTAAASSWPGLQKTPANENVARLD